MDKMFEKLMEKKKGKAIPEEYKNAKMSTLSALHDEMSKMMGEDLKGGASGLKKVTVASDKPEGLVDGLDKAKEMLGGDEDGEESPEAEDEEGSADADMISKQIEHEAAEGEMSEDEIDMLIHELEQKKAELAAKK